MKMNTKKMVFMAMLIALSVALVFATRIPWPTFTSYEYDAGDIPMLLATYIFGPVAGLIVVVLASAIQALTISAQSGWVGFVMHVIASGALVAVSGLIYKLMNKLKKPELPSLAVSSVSGTVAMAAIMVVANIIFVPIFMGAPLKAVIPMLLPITIPFNLVKAGINSILAAAIYMPLKNYIKTLLA